MQEYILVTGSAGFIGYHLSKLLLEKGFSVVGIDNMNGYYDVGLKKGRNALLLQYPGYTFFQMDLTDSDGLDDLFGKYRFAYVVNLAAQAGVRYSLTNPRAYLDSNLAGFLNIMEACRHHPVKHLIYASSSSVYGGNTRVPFSTDHPVDHPVSLYAATKKANELMAHAYSHLYAIPTTGLRFFTVYGPWGRPDMAYYLFTQAIMQGKPIKVFNHGQMERDFTYVDDVVEGIFRLLNHIPESNSGWNDAEGPLGQSSAPYRIYNIGNHSPVHLGYFIDVLERALGRTAIRQNEGMQPGDVPRTYADVADLEQAVGFSPATSIEQGLTRFVDWYKDYYAIKG